MRILDLGVWITCCAVLLTGCAGAQETEADAERELLGQRESAFLAAMGAGDAEEVAGFFSDDAVLHVADLPSIEGRDGIRGFYGNLFGFLSASESVPAARHISGSGDMAWSTGATTNTFRGPDGPVRYEGKYLLVWRKLAGEWMISAYSVSSDGSEST